MKKRFKLTIIFGSILILTLLYVYRVISLNQEYRNPVIKKYSINQPLEMGDFQFTLKQMKLIDGTELEELAPDVILATNADGTPYSKDKLRVCLAYIEIKKRGDSDDTLDFTKVTIESGAWGNGINNAIFSALNPNVSISKIKMAQNETQNVVLPFSMIDTMFKDADWKHINERNFSIIFNLYPEKIIFTSK